MTKYVINPCTDDVWVKVFRRIRRVAKQSGMYIKSIDFSEITEDLIVVFAHPFTEFQYPHLAKKVMVPNVITTIVLEKIPYENAQFVRGRKTYRKEKVNTA